VQIAICAALIAWQILIPPIIGVANNADFGKVLDWFHYKGDPEDEYKFVQTHFVYEAGRPNYGGERSSAVLLGGVALMVNRAISFDGSLDLRAIAIVHLAIFLAGVWLLRPRQVFSGLVFVAMIVLILTDTVYATMLNSFYEDAATMVFLLVALALALRISRGFRVRDAIWCAAAAALAVSSKDQHCVLAVPFAIFLAWECMRAGRRGLAAALALMVIAAGAFMWIGKEKYHANNAFYTVVFHRILPASPDPDRDLRELGLGPEYRPLIGKSVFDEAWKMEGLDAFALRDKLARDRSFLRLARFYLRHPSQAARGILESLGEAGRQRTTLGNFPRSAGKPEFAESERWTLWSNFKREILMEHGTRYLIWFAAAAAVLLLAMRGATAALLVVVCAVIELLVTSLADALEIARHMFVFNFLCDLMIVFAVIAWRPAARAGQGPAADLGVRPTRGVISSG
jgi:hypothetical protein